MKLTYKGKSAVITALTGTASVHVLRDIQRELNIKKYNNSSDMKRSEIDFLMIPCETNQKEEMLIENLYLLPEIFKTDYKTFYSMDFHKNHYSQEHPMKLNQYIVFLDSYSNQV